MEKDNVKGILKILRIMALIRSFIYLIGGILIIFFNKKLFDFIFIIVGIDIILLSSLDLLQEFLEFNNHRSNNRIGTSLLVLVIGVLILAIFNDDISTSTPRNHNKIDIARNRAFKPVVIPIKPKGTAQAHD